MDNWNSKQKIIAQIVCLLLSIGLWFYVTNIENPLKTYELSKIPVELLNVDSLRESGLALAPNQQLYVNLTIEGQSQDIFRVDKSEFKLTVDLSEFALVKGTKKIPVTISESPNNIKIKNSTGLTVNISIEDYISKEVPVKSKIEVISKSSYYVATPMFSPNVVTVSGPESLVNKVDNVVAEGQESNAVETIVKNYMLTPVDEEDNVIDGVELSQKWSEATISINEGKTVPIKINTTGNLSSGLRIKSIEAKEKEIGITGPKDLLNNINEIGTEVIDLSQINESTTVEVALGIPDNILIHNGEYSVSVNIVVEKIQSKEFTIGYSIKGLTTGMKIEPKSEKVTITISGYEDDLALLTEANFKAELDLSQYTNEGSFSKEPVVTLINSESEISIDSISKVDFNITKEKTDVSTGTNPGTNTGTNPGTNTGTDNEEDTEVNGDIE